MVDKKRAAQITCFLALPVNPIFAIMGIIFIFDKYESTVQRFKEGKFICFCGLKCFIFLLWLFAGISCIAGLSLATIYVLDFDN